MSNIVATVAFISVIVLSFIGIQSVLVKYECDIRTGKICTLIAVPEKGE